MKPNITKTQHSVTFCNESTTLKFSGSIILAIVKGNKTTTLNKVYLVERQMAKDYEKLEKDIRKVVTGKTKSFIFEDSDKKVTVITSYAISGSEVTLSKMEYKLL